MKKSEFSKRLKAFKLVSIGAACFVDPVTGDKFCANSLTQQQAQDFATQHNLQLLNWNSGLSCTEVTC